MPRRNPGHRTLSTCAACGAEISRNAKACPACGQPHDRTDDLIRIFTGISMFGLIVWLLFQCTGPTERPPVDCRATLTCWAQRHRTAAELACAEPITRMLMHPHRWEDSGGPEFFTWGWAEQGDGVLVYAGTNLSVRADRNAWSVRVFSCTYDPVNQRVLSASLDR